MDRNRKWNMLLALLLVSVGINIVLSLRPRQERTKVETRTVWREHKVMVPAEVNERPTGHHTTTAEERPRHDGRDTVILVRHDTVTNTYTVDVPLTQKVYRDSSYTAFVSGYRPSLDSIFVRERLTERTVTRYKTRRLGIGLQVGYGYNGTGVTPYVGIGVQYNFFGL